MFLVVASKRVMAHCLVIVRGAKPTEYALDDVHRQDWPKYYLGYAILSTSRHPGCHVGGTTVALRTGLRCSRKLDAG